MNAAFFALDYATQVARLDVAARSALAQYGLIGAQIERLTYARDVVYRVQVASRRYKLRLHLPDRPALDAHNRAVPGVLAALVAAGLCVPAPIAAEDGASVVAVAVDGLDGPLTGSLQSWIMGEPRPAADLTTPDLYMVGGFLGRLHNVTATLPAYAGLLHLNLTAMFDADAFYDPGAGAHIFSRDHRVVFEQVAARTTATLQRLGDDYGIIHADMLSKNYVFGPDGRVCPFDFDTVNYGHYLYDLAPPLLEISARPDYSDLKAALWQGYNRERPQLPERLPDLETLVAARHVASCYWIAMNLHQPQIGGHASQIITARVAELREYLATGRLRRRSQTF